MVSLTNGLVFLDRHRCASVVVDDCDFCENIYFIALLQDIHTPMVHMVRTYRWLGMHLLYFRHHPCCLSCLSASAVLLGHDDRGWPLRE